jgi:hypothetical protein
MNRSSQQPEDQAAQRADILAIAPLRLLRAPCRLPAAPRAQGPGGTIYRR